MIKELFYKTYKVTFSNKEKTKYKIEFVRGFTWEVIKSQVKRAEEIAEEIAEENGGDWWVVDIVRIY